MEKYAKRKAFVYGLAAILISSLLGLLCYDLGIHHQSFPLPTAASPESFLETFTSAEELGNFLTSNSKTQGPFPYYGPEDVTFMGPERMSGASDANAKSGSLTFQYSSTNVQVADVDEADSVKTDGEYVYILSGDIISVVRAYPAMDAGGVSRIVLNGLYPVGFFVSGNRLAVVGSKYNMASRSTWIYGFADVDVKTFISIYDIQDRARPVLLRDLTLTGSYFDARRIGDYVYFVASQPAYMIYDTVILPKVYSDGQTKNIEPTEIHYFNGSDDYYQYTTFVSVNIQDSAEAPVYLTVMLGGTSTMYVSLNNMYVTFRNWADETTAIYRVHIEGSSMNCEAKGIVRGHEINQFSMDEYGDSFRIATTSWAGGAQQNNLYVMNRSLDVIGRLENLATGENLHSARFMGNRCYLVTFVTTDPLFVINLTKPEEPEILGELRIPGYSDYLHPYDETHLIGVGKQAVGAEEGNFAWYQGIKVSLFDVSNVSNPRQLDAVTIGDRGSDTPILRDHKAFLFDRAKNLLVIPVQVAEIDESQYPSGVPPYVYGQTVWQGVYVYNFTLEQGFNLRGQITHVNSSTYLWDSTYWIRRSLYIEDILYTVSDRNLRLNYVADLTPIKDIPIP